MSEQGRRVVPALVVKQWLAEWDAIDFDASEHRRRPEPWFYLFTLPARDLRILTGIYRRSTEEGLPRVRDFGIQRRHNDDRSKEISRFVRRGYPWSTLSTPKRKSGQYQDLVKPGWLPTAIVLNVLTQQDTRRGRSVHQEDLIEVVTRTGEQTAEIQLPRSYSSAAWEPKGIGPLEVIDGQHRLWAFEAHEQQSDFQLPVVAFLGLDLSWQAYLFYTINIKPKRINTSLAYDLYPMLRTADWLERAEEHVVYRETRAQELTEALWSFPDSPWYQRIDMLGEGGRREVSQAAWIRSLTATFVKSWEGKGVRIGGLFGAPVGDTKLVLDWNRSQQSAVLVYLWQCVAEAVRKSADAWVEYLRHENDGGEDSQGSDPAFAGRWTLINTDQGVRGVLSVMNDLCFVTADALQLAEWESDSLEDGLDVNAITEAIDSFKTKPGGEFVARIAAALASYDWRTSGSPDLTEEQRQSKARFRGSTGYREIRNDLVRHLVASSDDEVSAAAVEVAGIRGIEL